jgi:translocation and assembly module TamB
VSTEPPTPAQPIEQSPATERRSSLAHEDIGTSDHSTATASTSTEGSATKTQTQRRRQRRGAIASLVITVIITAIVLVARTEWATHKMLTAVVNEVRAQTGLELRVARGGWSWRRLAVHAEGIEVRHPTGGLLARVDWVDVRPTLRTLLQGPIRIGTVELDGGEIRLVFRNGKLINGPTIKPSNKPSQGTPSLPFRDIALSDVNVIIDDDRWGVVSLQSVDVDVRNDLNRRLLIGLNAHSGHVETNLRNGNTNDRCFTGDIQRVELHAELARWQLLRVGSAHLEALGAQVHVEDALVPLDLQSELSAAVSAIVPLSVATCPLPRLAPLIRGRVEANARARFHPQTGSLHAEGHAESFATTITLWDPRPLGRNGTFGAGQHATIDFHADENALVVDRLEARYGGGLVVSPAARRRDRPITLHFRPSFTMDGVFETQGLRFEQLMRELAITDFARVLWTIDALAEIHLDPARFGQLPDRARPALTIDITADTRDFAIIKDFHRWGPPFEPVISIARGRAATRLEVDSLFVRFRNMSADLAHTHVDGDEVEVRTVHDPAHPDMIVRNIRGTNMDLSDVGSLAGIPIAGHADTRINGSGTFADIIVQGQTHVRDFHFADLPLGDIETPPNQPWQLHNITLTAPVLLARSGKSTFTLLNSSLDFSRYTMVSKTRVESSDFQLADYYHMFKFEHDPVFEPYTGGTMQDCALSSRDHSLPQSECWVSDTSRPGNRRGEPRPAHARPRHGFLRADVEFVLGRPGDDRKGVMHADVRAWDLVVHGYDETIQHADVHTVYDWLIKDRGFRGARLNIEYARGRVANGTVEAAGTVDLGGRMHLSGAIRHANLGEFDVMSGTGLRGVLNGTGLLEGTTEEQRWSMNMDVQGLAGAQREFGDVHVRLQSAPDPSARGVQAQINQQIQARTHAPQVVAELPAPTRWAVQFEAVDSRVRANGSFLHPFVQEPWQDVDGHWQRDFTRSWRDGVVEGTLDVSENGTQAAVDLLPWVPARTLARLGSNPLARAALSLSIRELSLRDPMHARARLNLSTFEVRALGVSAALPPRETLSVCANRGQLWIAPSAARDEAVCDELPALFSAARRGQTAQHVTQSTRIVGPEGVQLDVSGGGTVDGSLALLVGGNINLARLSGRVPTLDDAHGLAEFSLAVNGTLTAPELNGLIQLSDGSLHSSALPQPIEDLDLTLRFTGTELSIERARARYGPSSVDLSGGIVRVRGREIERVDVPLVVRNFSFEPISGAEVALDADARVSFADGDNIPTINGDITLGRVRYTRPVDLSIIQESNGVSSSASAEPYDPSQDRVQLALNVRAREPIRVRNNLIDADVVFAGQSTAIRVVGTDQRPSILGQLNIPRGRIFFRGNEFDIRRSRIDFDNPERISPAFDLLAVTEIRRSSSEGTNRNQWRIDLHAYGTRERFSLDMSADPTLSREDIALMLTFRMTRAELDQLGAGEFGQILAVEALSNLAGVDRLVRRNVPIIDDFNITSGYSPAQGRTVPQVTVRVPLATGIRAGATVNITEQREARGTIDGEITRQWGGQISVDNNTQSRSVNAGFDVRYRLEFE